MLEELGAALPSVHAKGGTQVFNIGEHPTWPCTWSFTRYYFSISHLFTPEPLVTEEPRVVGLWVAEHGCSTEVSLALEACFPACWSFKFIVLGLVLLFASRVYVHNKTKIANLAFHRWPFAPSLACAGRGSRRSRLSALKASACTPRALQWRGEGTSIANV